MHDVFLSYSTQDRERLQPLFQALERQGWSVFWDHRTIEIGDQWGKKIDRAIRTSKCVVVVWSKASVDSEWVLEEANIGKQRDVLLPIRIDEVIFPVGFTMRQTGDFVHWNGDANDPQFIRLAGKVRELVAQHDADQAQRKAEAAAEQERLAREKAATEQQVREQAEQQRRLAEEARIRREAAEATEREQLAKEKFAAEQKAREVAERQRKLDEAQALLAEENAAKEKKLAQQRAAEEKAKKEAARQAKARQEQLSREQSAVDGKASKVAERQSTTDSNLSIKKFSWLPALLISVAAFGGGYYWLSMENSPVGYSSAANSPAPQMPPVKEESLAGQAPTAELASPAGAGSQQAADADKSFEDRVTEFMLDTLEKAKEADVDATNREEFYNHSKKQIERIWEGQKKASEEIHRGKLGIISNGDSTVTDFKNKLTWKQCSEGQNGNNCSGDAAEYTWDDAMAKFGKGVSFAGYSDWRMPTKDELRTLVYCSNGTPQATVWDKGCGGKYQHPTIDLKAFPNTPDATFWSASPDVGYSGTAWYVNFYNGYNSGVSKTEAFQVRLVRSGQ